MGFKGFENSTNDPPASKNTKHKIKREVMLMHLVADTCWLYMPGLSAGVDPASPHMQPKLGWTRKLGLNLSMG